MFSPKVNMREPCEQLAVQILLAWLGAPLFIVFLCSPKRKQQQKKTNLDILQFAAISF